MNKELEAVLDVLRNRREDQISYLKDSFHDDEAKRTLDYTLRTERLRELEEVTYLIKSLAVFKTHVVINEFMERTKDSTITWKLGNMFPGQSEFKGESDHAYYQVTVNRDLTGPLDSCFGMVYSIEKPRPKRGRKPKTPRPEATADELLATARDSVGEGRFVGKEDLVELLTLVDTIHAHMRQKYIPTTLCYTP